MYKLFLCAHKACLYVCRGVFYCVIAVDDVIESAEGRVVALVVMKMALL